MRAVTTILGTTLLALSAASSAAAGPARACVEQSEKLVGQRAGVAAQPLKKVRDAEPDYPARQGSSKALSSIWIGEALVDTSGTVREVWTIRPLRFEPAWPEFEAAIPAAIRKWSYEPALIDGTAVPVCVTVSVRIRWS
jgi:outer membrane biosynthesis protein TonB